MMNEQDQVTWTNWPASKKKRYVDDTARCARLGEALREHQVKVANLWAPARDTSNEVPVPVMRPPKPARKFRNEWICSDPLPEPKAPFRRLFGTRLQDCVSEWFHRVHAPTSEIRWINFYQLYVHFQNFVEVLVVKLDGKWSVDFTPGCRLRNHFKLALRVKGFRLMLQQWFKDHSITFHTAVLRSFSNWIACHRGCVAIPIHDRVCQDVETFLSSVMARPATGQGKCLDHVRFWCLLGQRSSVAFAQRGFGTGGKKKRKTRVFFWKFTRFFLGAFVIILGFLELSWAMLERHLWVVRSHVGPVLVVLSFCCSVFCLSTIFHTTFCWETFQYLSEYRIY